MTDTASATDAGKAGPVLVTGAAGFIGFHVSQALTRRGQKVVGVDTCNDYYDPALKYARLDQLKDAPNFTFLNVDLADRAAVEQLFEQVTPDRVIHLAAQAGVRYSIENPHAYLDANLAGFMNILEGCRHHTVAHLTYASSSSVYGANTKMPFAVGDAVDHPVSLYAASKKANELMAHCYSHLYALPTTGLRFFTVYGPWGRPDMALFLFTKAILANEPIKVFNNGQMARDFTYIDDIVEGVLRVSETPAAPNPAWDSSAPDPASAAAPYRIYNIGNNQPVSLLHMIDVLEKAIGKRAEKIMLAMQPGDVHETFADITDLERDFGYRPATKFEDGVAKFVAWYRQHYGNTL